MNTKETTPGEVASSAQLGLVERLRQEASTFATPCTDSVLHNEAAEEIERLRDMLFAQGAMKDAPCFCCGYNGPGYFQPSLHACATPCRLRL